MVVKVLDSKTTVQHNKPMHLEDSMVMYSIYYAETLKKLLNTVHHIHNFTSPTEKLFAEQKSIALLQPIYPNMQGIQHYSINPLLYQRIVKEKYVLMYKEFITQLCIYVTTIRILAKGYLPISLITSLKLKEILIVIKTTVRKTNPDYDLVLKTLVTFGIDRDRNLIIQFPVFIQPYTQQPLILYQIETVPVPIIDQNMQAHSYTHIQVDRPYIVLISETYITIRQ